MRGEFSVPPTADKARNGGNGDDLNTDGAPLHANTEWDLDAGINMCESVEAGHSKHDDTAAILDHIGGHKTIRPARQPMQIRRGGPGGQADCYLRMPTRKGYVEKIWDHAGGSLIATEAGRRRHGYHWETAGFFPRPPSGGEPWRHRRRTGLARTPDHGHS